MRNIDCASAPVRCPFPAAGAVICSLDFSWLSSSSYGGSSIFWFRRGMVYYRKHVVLRRTLGALTSSRSSRSLTLMAASLTSASLMSGPSQSERCSRQGHWTQHTAAGMASLNQCQRIDKNADIESTHYSLALLTIVVNNALPVVRSNEQL